MVISHTTREPHRNATGNNHIESTERYLEGLARRCACYGDLAAMAPARNLLVRPIGDSCVPHQFETCLQLDITWIERLGLVEAHRFVVGAELRPLFGEVVARRLFVIEAGLLWCRYARNIDRCATTGRYVKVRDLIGSNDLQSDQRGKKQHDTSSLIEGTGVQPATHAR
jgi:hypothetical protein